MRGAYSRITEATGCGIGYAEGKDIAGASVSRCIQEVGIGNAKSGDTDPRIGHTDGAAGTVQVDGATAAEIGDGRGSGDRPRKNDQGIR